MIVYDRLWKTMKAKNISQYRLIKYYKISAGQIGRLKENAYVSTHTLDVLCTILNCAVEDIVEFRMDNALASQLGVSLSLEDAPSHPSISSQKAVPQNTPASSEHQAKQDTDHSDSF